MCLGEKECFVTEKVWKLFSEKENYYFGHFVTLCPELLHLTTSREMGIHFQASTAVTKPFNTKSS